MQCSELLVRQRVSRGPGAALAAVFGKAQSRQLRRELAYITAATQRVQSSATCQVRQPSTPSVVHGSPSPALLSALGVLRRPATPADRLGAASLEGIPDTYAGYTRRAVATHGTAYYIVPARTDPATWSPSSRCFALQEAALARALPTIPAPFRAPTRALQAKLIAYARNLVARAPRDTLCLVTVGPGNGSGAACGDTLAAIQHDGLPTDDNGTFTAIVPLPLTPDQLHRGDGRHLGAERLVADQLVKERGGGALTRGLAGSVYQR
jgi:hypothetical protein